MAWLYNILELHWYHVLPEELRFAPPDNYSKMAHYILIDSLFT